MNHQSQLEQPCASELHVESRAPKRANSAEASQHDALSARSRANSEAKRARRRDGTGMLACVLITHVTCTPSGQLNGQLDEWRSKQPAA